MFKRFSSVIANAYTNTDNAYTKIVLTVIAIVLVAIWVRLDGLIIYGTVDIGYGNRIRIDGSIRIDDNPPVAIRAR